jgi:hypothetical protein
VKGAPICPVCCGENRVVVFNCPEDCPYLKPHEEYHVSRLHRIYARSGSATEVRRWLSVLEESGALYSMIQEAIVEKSMDRGPSNEDIGEALRLLLRTYESEDAGVHYVQKSPSAPVNAILTAVRDRVEQSRGTSDTGSESRSPQFSLSQVLETLRVILHQLEFFESRGERFSEYLLKIHPAVRRKSRTTDSPLILP